MTTDWMLNGSCRTADPELFFPRRRNDARTREAVAICADCPVQATCLTYATSHPELEGVWGGQAFPIEHVDTAPIPAGERCLVEDCRKKRSPRHGTCDMHRVRMQRHGSYDLPDRTPAPTRICVVARCGTKAARLGLCNKHYLAWRRTDRSTPVEEWSRAA